VPGVPVRWPSNDRDWSCPPAASPSPTMEQFETLISCRRSMRRCMHRLCRSKNVKPRATDRRPHLFHLVKGTLGRIESAGFEDFVALAACCGINHAEHALPLGSHHGVFDRFARGALSLGRPVSETGRSGAGTASKQPPACTLSSSGSIPTSPI
jgi:hypothetical protein